MTILYDTSALISLFLKEHPYNEKSVLTHIDLEKSDSDFFISTHSIAEFFSTVTKGRSYLNLSSIQADDLITQIVNNFFSVVSLTKKDYLTATTYLAGNKLTGGIVYDAIIAQASSKVNADYIVSMDEHDFMEISGLTKSDLINPSYR